MRAAASSPRWVKKAEGINARMIIKIQTFFKSCQDGPSIAPMLKNKKIKTQSCHLAILI